jgi:hypothetical protein
MNVTMTADDWEFLSACFEARARQLEMIGPFAKALGVPENEVFYLWALQRQRCSQFGNFGHWSYFFHGQGACDLKNETDGRFLRYDFGPGGRADCLDSWGVLQFIMTSKEPWSSFQDLQLRLSELRPPYDENSGDFLKVSAAWERLEALGCFEPADADLMVLRQRYSAIGSDGSECMIFPEEIPYKTIIDMRVAHRSVLTARAGELMNTGRKNFLSK